MSDPKENDQKMVEGLNSSESKDIVSNNEIDPSVVEPLDRECGSQNEDENESLPNDAPVDDEWLDIIGSGDFKKRVLRAGNGIDTRPQQGNSVTINYICYDVNSSVIEENHDFEMIIGDLDVTQGFDLVLALMETDEKAEVLIPSRLAYGKLGRSPDIPENYDLRYEIEILNVKDIHEKELNLTEIMELGNKKRDRGNFWYGRSDYLNAVHCYQRAASILDGVHDGSENSAEMLQNILDTKLKVHNNMAAAQLKLESYDQALKSVNFVLRIQPKNVKAHFRKAKILTAKGQTDDALLSMRRAAELEPETKVIQQELQRLVLKQKLEEKNQRAMYRRMFSQGTSKAKSYKKWFQLKPWNMMAASCLGLALGVAAYRQYFTA